VEGREKVKVRFASDLDHALYHAQCRIAGKVEKLN